MKRKLIEQRGKNQFLLLFINFISCQFNLLIRNIVLLFIDLDASDTPLYIYLQNISTVVLMDEHIFKVSFKCYWLITVST